MIKRPTLSEMSRRRTSEMSGFNEDSGNETFHDASHGSSAAGPTARFRRVKAPRKRSVTACNFCRLRKVKCDNTRPVCSFCIRHSVDCVYEADNADQKHLFVLIV